MNIGELFVQIGAQVDSSWLDGMNKLKGMGTAAKQAASVAKSAMDNMRHAMRNASLDATMAADKVITAAQRQASAVEASARRQAAAYKLITSARNSAGGRAIQELRTGGDDSRGFGGVLGRIPLFENRRSPVTFGELRASMGISSDTNSSFNAMAPGGGRLRAFRPGSGGGMFGEGDPFAPPAPPGQPPTPTRRRPGAGGGGRRGTNPYSRFGPLGEVSAFRRVILGAGIYQGAQSFGELADVYTSLQNRIRGISSSQGEANQTFERLRQIALNTRSSLESTGEAYVRIRNATEGMKLSQDDQFKVITRINMALATSGATASEARSGMMQLTQALAKGKLDGDEFRSLAENMPNVLKILQKSLGVTEGRLRQMSRAGELTREKIIKAFLGNNGVEDAFGKTNATFAQVFENFKTNLIVAFGEMARDQDLVESFAFALEYLAKAFILLAKAVGGILKFTKEFVQALKDGEVWAYALATAIGLTLLPSIISLLGYLLRLPVAFAEAAAAGRLFGSLGGAGGAAGTAGKAASGLGLLATGPIAAGAIAAGISEHFFGSPESTMDVLNANADKAFAAKGIVRNASNQVSIGPTTVTIYAKDGKDAKEQFDQQVLDRNMRHAAAALNRSGS